MTNPVAGTEGLAVVLTFEDYDAATETTEPVVLEDAGLIEVRLLRPGETTYDELSEGEWEITDADAGEVTVTIDTPDPGPYTLTARVTQLSPAGKFPTTRFRFTVNPGLFQG
jgi:hypothetical protein